MSAGDERACPACGAARHHVLGDKAGYRIGACEECRTLRVLNPPDAPASERYADYYLEPGVPVPDFVRDRLGRIVAGFERGRGPGSLLDVGCGEGAMLATARARGWAAVGVEVSRSAIEKLRASGHEVHHGELAEAGLAASSFDVVTLVEVLEHVGDPCALLREVARVVRPGGIVFATTPHGRGASVRVLGLRSSLVAPPEHLQLFSVAGIRRLLRRARLVPVSTRATGLNPSELLVRLRAGADAPASTARVEAAYAVNAALESSPARRLVKGAANAVLDAVRLGDGLRIHATPSPASGPGSPLPAP